MTDRDLDDVDFEELEEAPKPDEQETEYDESGYYEFIAENGPEWMTPMDVEILSLLSLGQGLILTPAVIAENIDYSRAGVSRRLNSLQASGFVDKKDRGKYVISEFGTEFLDKI